VKKNLVIIKILLALVTLFYAGPEVIAQPFADDIAAFKKQDSVKFPSKNSILFIGSSSFTMWTDIQNYFPGYPILNRGFGGSSLPDLIRYANDIIFPYHPKQIVIYCGENDIAASDTVTAKMVFDRFITLFSIIRKKLPTVPVVYVSMKPSPSRHHLRKKVIAGNTAIKNYLLRKKKTGFVDVYHKMINADGTPKADLFLEDELHMNKKGYAIWQKAIKPFLLK
jgi:lysophospholipase L1-like esterase